MTGRGTKVRHIPRRSGVGMRQAIRPPWLPHPLSMRAAEQRRAAALRAQVKAD